MNISIIICTINVDFAEKALKSLVGKLKENDEVLLIIDGNEYITSQEIFKFMEKNKWRIIINKENKGLSYSRNLGIKEIKNDYCIFLDDDTMITDFVIERYRRHFQNGYDMVGGLLKLPEDYPSLPRWFPDGMSSLLGIHTFQYKIWGANFGFNAKFAKENNIKFKQELGRKGNGLQSGDDTTFIKQYCSNGKKALFDKDIIVYHYINKKRYKFRYMLRRAFWQGISEVRRGSFLIGLKKEIERAKKIDIKNNQHYILPKVISSVIFMFAFLFGAIMQKTLLIIIQKR